MGRGGLGGDGGRRQSGVREQDGGAAEVPGNQKQMQLLRISTVNPPIPPVFFFLFFIAASGY